MNYSQLVTEVQSYLENTFPINDINTFIEQTEQRVFNTIQFPSLRKNVTGTLSAGNPYLTCPNDFLAPYSLAVFSNVTANAISGSVGSNTITVSTNPGIFAGQNVIGTGIGNQCMVISVVSSMSGYTVTLSQVNIASVNGFITFQTDYSYLLNKDVNFIRECYSTTYLNTPKHYALFGPQFSAPLYLSFLLGPTPDQAYSAEMHYFYYPDSIIQSVISNISVPSANNGYTNGTYLNVPLTGNSNGSGAQADIVVSSNQVTSVTLRTGGCLYSVGDALSATSLVTTGTPFSVTVNSVVNPTGQSWLGNNFDTVLLYGTLLEAYTYQKGDKDLIGFYEKRYMEALAIAKRLGDGLEREDAYRSGQFRIQPVQ